MSYTPLHNYGSPALARMIRDGARREHGFRHPATAAAQGRLDALLGRSAPDTGVGRVSYARQKGERGYRNAGHREHLGTP